MSTGKGSICRSRSRREHRISNLIVVLGVCALGLNAAIVAQTPSVQPPSSVQPEKSPFPDGPGRDALFKVCHDCHGPESVLAHLKTRDEWSKTLDEMAANGATGSDREWTDILEYLVKHYSPIAVNKATAAELAATLDVANTPAPRIPAAARNSRRLR